MNAILSSKSGTPFPKWMARLALVIGLLLAADALRQFSFHKLIVGVCCAYAAGYSKRMYLADEGIVRESGSWFASRKEVLPWEEVAFVTLALKWRQIMAFFERGETGWRLLFDRDQREPLESLLRVKCPGVEIDVV